MDEPGSSQRWSERTTADLSGLLLELGRALKASRFYPPDHLGLRDILDRAFLAWQVELERAGPIELHLTREGIRCKRVEGDARPEPSLLEPLRSRGLEHLRVTLDATRQGFGALVAALARDPEAKRTETLASELAPLPDIRSGAIQINYTEPVLDWAAEDEPELPQHEAVACEPPEPPAETPAPTEASLGSALLEQSCEGTAAFVETDAEKPTIDECPLQAPAADMDGERLRQCLLRLDASASDVEYDTLCRRASELAHGLAEGGALDEGHRAMRVFAEHASGQGGRSGAQLRMAQVAFERFARGRRLRELIERAADARGGAGVRAAQVILQLGQRTVGPILEVIEAESEPDRIAQLTAVVVALGERAEPVLEDAIEHGPLGCARIAVRLAGELQSPVLIETLVAMLERGNRPELDRESAKALAVTGSDRAAQALCQALSARREGLPEVAAYCLGSLGKASAVDPLLAALDRAVRGGRDDLARACIRALGQLASERATPKLAALLERRGLLHKKSLRALKLASLTALAQIPCGEARRAITRARKSRDRAVRQRAVQLAG